MSKGKAGAMVYTASQLQGEVEGLLDSMIRDLESKADCQKCRGRNVYISDKDSIARNYAKKVADLVARNINPK